MRASIHSHLVRTCVCLSTYSCSTGDLMLLVDRDGGLHLLNEKPAAFAQTALSYDPKLRVIKRFAIA
jgi:hypothetical protein